MRDLATHLGRAAAHSLKDRVALNWPKGAEGLVNRGRPIKPSKVAPGVPEVIAPAPWHNGSEGGGRASPPMFVSFVGAGVAAKPGSPRCLRPEENHLLIAASPFAYPASLSV